MFHVFWNGKQINNQIQSSQSKYLEKWRRKIRGRESREQVDEFGEVDAQNEIILISEKNIIFRIFFRQPFNDLSDFFSSIVSHKEDARPLALHL